MKIEIHIKIEKKSLKSNKQRKNRIKKNNTEKNKLIFWHNEYVISKYSDFLFPVKLKFEQINITI